MADRGRKKQNTNQQPPSKQGGGGGKGGGNFVPEEGFKFDFGAPNAPKDQKQKQSEGKQGGEKKPEKLTPVMDFSGPEGQALLKGITTRLGHLVGESSGYLESLPQVVQTRVKALKKLQADHDKLEDEFEKELQELEKKYAILKKPLFERRTAIVVGDSEPTAEEAAFEPEEKEEEATKEGEKKEGAKKEEQKKKEEPKKEGAKQESDKNENIKGIPEFWLQALRHHPDFDDLITEKDIDALKYLKDVQVESIEDGPSFVIVFTFDPNPFFEETVLKKSYFLKQAPYGDVLFNSAKGTDIHWKAGKNLTVEIISKTTGGGKGRRGKGAPRQQPRTIKVEQPCESFFNFFNPDAFNSPGGEGVDELEDEELEALYQSDYEIGAAIKEEIIPQAVLWYTGEADIPEYEDGEEDDDIEDEDEDDDDGEDDDGGRAGAEEYNSDEDEDFTPPPPGQEQQPECKQQ